MRTIDLLSLMLHPFDGGTVTMLYPGEELEPGLLLLKARKCPDNTPWPEIEVLENDGFSVKLKVAHLTEEEFAPFEVSLDEPFNLVCGDFGEMTFTLEEDCEDDDGRWDPYS